MVSEQNSVEIIPAYMRYCSMFHVTMHETPAGRPALSRQIWLPKKTCDETLLLTTKKDLSAPSLHWTYWDRGRPRRKGVFFFSDFAFGSGGNQSFLFSPVAWKLPARFEAAERRRGGGGGAKAKIFGVLSSQSVADVVSNEEKKIGVERRLCPSAEDGDKPPRRV